MSTKKKPLHFGCELWSINRILRFTGWRLYVSVDGSLNMPFNPQKPTKIGFMWYGWSFLRDL